MRGYNHGVEHPGCPKGRNPVPVFKTGTGSYSNFGPDQLEAISIWRGFASAVFGSVIVRMPSLWLARI